MRSVGNSVTFPVVKMLKIGLRFAEVNTVSLVVAFIGTIAPD